MLSPCFKCDNRSPTCHGSCDVYDSWVKELRDAKKVKYKDYNEDLNLLSIQKHYKNMVFKKKRRNFKR